MKTNQLLLAVAVISLLSGTEADQDGFLQGIRRESSSTVECRTNRSVRQLRCSKNC